MQQTYGLKMLNCPSKIKEIISFGLELWELVNKAKFRKVSSNFQNLLKEDMKAIKKSKSSLFLQTKHQIYA